MPFVDHLTNVIYQLIFQIEATIGKRCRDFFKKRVIKIQYFASAFNNFLSMVTPKVTFDAYDIQNFNSSRNELNMDIQGVVFENRIPTEMSLNEILSAQMASEIKEFRCNNIENPKEVALLIGISGSTCLPRAAELSHLSSRTLLHPVYTTTLLNRIAMCTSSVRWISYFILLLTGLRFNCTKIIVDDEEDGKFHCDVIKKYKIDDNTEISWQYVNELYITIDLEKKSFILTGGTLFFG